jgi:signal transduction histidine kinase/ActR/RegA family two-component response regulator
MTPDDAARDRVLVLAPAGRDAPLTQAVLARAGVVASTCRDLEQLCDALGNGAAAALITEEAFIEWDARRLVDWIAAQEPWSDLPFLILLDRGAIAEGRQDITFLKTSANITLLERPISASALVSTVRAALRARRRQYEVKDTLEALAQSQDRYRTLADELEHLVAARTQSLAQANEQLVREIAERERAEGALRQAQKLESIGQLTSGVAHDFNNLLQAVIGNLELAQSRTEDEAVRSVLHGARRAAERGARLTSQLLAFSRKQRLAPKAVDLNAVVSGASDMLFRTMGTSIRIETVLESAAWPALVDPTQIELVLLNLALNGRDAMPEGGRLTLSTANVRAADRPSDLPARDYVLVAVSDTGTGMNDTVRAKAFEPFFTTKDVGKGSGLGLSMVHGVATQSGGGVAIDSGLGAGTTVRVYLPRAPEVAAVQPAPEPAATGPAATATILVVDDDPEVREVAVSSLAILGYRTLEAEDGEAALKLVAGSERIDLLLVDVAMPGTNGIEVVRRARLRRPALRALFVTGNAASYRAELLGGDGLLEKPYGVKRLGEMVTRALEQEPHPPRQDYNMVALKPSLRR